MEAQGEQSEPVQPNSTEAARKEEAGVQGQVFGYSRNQSSIMKTLFALIGFCIFKTTGANNM